LYGLFCQYCGFPSDEEQVSLSDVILLDPSRMSDLLGWLARYVTLDAQFPRVSLNSSFLRTLWDDNQGDDAQSL